jgi:hypothetical protein
MLLVLDMVHVLPFTFREYVIAKFWLAIEYPSLFA